MNGFLGTGATFRADLNLVLQILMGLALLVGWRLAQRKYFRAHGVCQSTVMIFNLLLIASIMLPAFHRQVRPKIPSGLNDAYYLTAATHAGLGTLAELLGLYVVLVATKLLPGPLRFKNWKRWMKTTLALWWARCSSASGRITAGTFANRRHPRPPPSRNPLRRMPLA